MLFPNDIKDVELLLKDCKSVKQMFQVLERKFDLENCNPGSITKPTFISGIVKGIVLLQPKLK